MKKTASQIAEEVLFKLSASQDRPPGLPAILAGGTGLGLLAGGAGGSLQSGGDISRALQISHDIPAQRVHRQSLDDLLGTVRKQAPDARGLSDRALVKRLLRTQQPPEVHYALRRGYEEGLAGLSRSTKTLRALRNKILKNISSKSAIGAGVGLGGGLLAASALGHFD